MSTKYRDTSLEGDRTVAANLVNCICNPVRKRVRQERYIDCCCFHLITKNNKIDASCRKKLTLMHFVLFTHTGEAMSGDSLRSGLQ